MTARRLDDHPAAREEPLAHALAQPAAQGARGRADLAARARAVQAADPRALPECRRIRARRVRRGGSGPALLRQAGGRAGRGRGGADGGGAVEATRLGNVALFGAALDATVLRRVIGQPQFAVVMLTIGLGAIFRSFASITWGSEIYTLPTPFSARATRLGGVTVSHEYVSIIVGTVVLCAALYAFFTYTRVGVAMQAASQNQLAAYYMGIPVKRMFSLIWAISAAVAAIAGVLLAPVSLIDINLGFIGLKAFAAAVLGGFGSIPGALVGGVTIGLIELFSGAYLPQGFKDVAAYVVLLVVLAVRPQGMFGSIARKKV